MFIILAIPLALGMAMHWPLDALGDLANDFYCWASATVLHDPIATARAESSGDESAQRVSCHQTDLTYNVGGFFQVTLHGVLR